MKPTQHAGTRTLWVPSLGTACGIAEYTAHLAQYVSGVWVTAAQPEIDRLRLLHVQHEFVLFDDAELSAYIRCLRDLGVPTVVTEHSVVIDERLKLSIGSAQHRRERVLTAKRGWERAATALVALTQISADILRLRWPDKRIVHIPHGCPTWFPPRKLHRGRVIGAFGFLAPYKGFWDLLTVLREVPGTELVIYSHPRYASKYPEYERDWIRASEGLPVRWVREFLPEAEIAKRLAAEADILAFWYRAGRFASSSGAIRVGLATGVPVLASPIGTFEDVREVTYQPEDLLDGVRRLLDDTRLRNRLAAVAREYCRTNDWSNSARLHLKLWRELEGVGQ